MLRIGGFADYAPYTTITIDIDIYRVRQNKIPNTKIAIIYISEMIGHFAPSFAHFFGTKLCTNVLLCAVFT